MAQARRPLRLYDDRSAIADVPMTLPRRVATAMLPLTPGPLGAALHHRLMVGGMYGDERWIRQQLGGVFDIETLDRFQSDVHLHGRCVARLRAELTLNLAKPGQAMTCATRACW